MSFILRFLDLLASNCFLLGPRGTGKSMWLEQAFPAANKLDFLDSATLRTYSAHPERLRQFVDAADARQPIIIDEVQRVPEILSMVHLLIEERKNIRFILTGSSARKLRQTGVDLLGGRAAMATLHPFMAAELGDQFNFRKYLTVGGIPLIYMSDAPEQKIGGYIDLYLDQEIRAEGLIRRIDDFNRFLEIVSFSHGQILSAAGIARECGVSRNTVESYLAILEDLHIAVRIQVFTKRAQRATVTHPKFFFFDCGLFRALRPRGPLDTQGDVDGPALEGMVLQHLRAWVGYSDPSMRIYYWHTRAGNEVDFVLYGNNGFYAVEVKMSRMVRPQDLRGLRAFIADYPEAKPLLLYGGTERLQIDGITCIPVIDFLKNVRPGIGLGTLLPGR